MQPQQAAQELLARRERRSSLVAWSTFRRKEYGQIPAQHHLLLLDYIQKAVDGVLMHPDTGDKCSNLIFLLPPGSAKSTYLSVDSIPWILQRKPGWRVLACSHSADLIESFSRECRNTVEQHQATLGYGLRADSKAVQEWQTSNRSSYRCAGVGAGISGRRAFFGAIDDYLGSREDADSKLIRDKQWHWYWNDFFPRLVPDAPQIIVANRQHEDDLVGRQLDKRAKKWVLVRIPFFAEENDPLGRTVGTSLWPEWFTASKVEEIRELQQVEPRTYAGLYQQRPAPEEGNFFKREWLVGYSREEYDILMQHSPRIYIACDFAVSEEKDANRSCFIPCAEAENGDIYILPDIFWKVAGPVEMMEAWLAMLKRRQPMVCWAEKGHISKSIGPFLKERMDEEGVYSYIQEVTPKREKDVRARSIQGRMSMKKVRFPKFAPWYTAAEHEMLTFPGGKTDDFVDALAHIGMGLNSLIRARPAKQSEPEDYNKSFVPTMGWVKKSSEQQRQAKLAKYQGR